MILKFITISGIKVVTDEVWKPIDAKNLIRIRALID